MYLFGDVENKFFYRNVLSEITEAQSLVLIHSLHDYKNLIQNSLMKLQEEVDCIISDNCNITSDQSSPGDLIRLLRLEDEFTYSNRDYKLKSIPIILVVKDKLNIAIAKSYGYTDVFVMSSVDDFTKILEKVKAATKAWRRKVLDELDDLGIRFNAGFIDFKRYDFKKGRSRSSQIISENFKLLPRKLNYSWIELNNKQIEKGVDKFVKILKKYDRDRNLRDESEIQTLFVNNSFLLKRDIYNVQLHEPYFNDSRIEEENKKPDFLLKPSLTFHTDLSVVEVKLPNELFLKKKKHIKNFYTNIWDYLCQINDYKEYLEKDEFQSLVYEVLRENPASINYNLLIGRNRDKEDAMYWINKRGKQFNFSPDIFLTYDDLLELQRKFADRHNLLEIK